MCSIFCLPFWPTLCSLVPCHDWVVKSKLLLFKNADRSWLLLHVVVPLVSKMRTCVPCFFSPSQWGDTMSSFFSSFLLIASPKKRCPQAVCMYSFVDDTLSFLVQCIKPSIVFLQLVIKMVTVCYSGSRTTLIQIVWKFSITCCVVVPSYLLW